MIYLNPPYMVVDGYTLLGDHADPDQFYVLPAAPALASGDDGRPAFSLVQYLGGGAGERKISGGFLTLTTELRVPEEALPQLTAKLAQRLGRPTAGLQLNPVLFDSGTVELIALGTASTPPDGNGGGEPSHGDAPPTLGAAAAAQPAGPFDVRILGSGRPSLGGSNQAVFQLALDANAAELLEACLTAPELPVIAIYRLSFAGLRPSFHVSVTADWRQVYHSLQNRAKANVYYVTADADVLITQTLQENHIAIDTQVFGTTDADRAAAERARKELSDWVLEHLFQPVADPKSATANAIGQVVDDTVWSLTRSLLPGVSYRLRLLDDDQLRMLSARMDESIAERREVIPQGTLGGMLHHYRLDDEGNERATWPALAASLVAKANLDGFARLEVQVACEDRFASDGLKTVQVEMARLAGDGTLSDNRTLIFRAATDRDQYVVNLLGRPINIGNPYRYRNTVEFDPAGVFGPHPALTSAWETGNAGELYVEPRTGYLVRQVQVGVSPIFSFSQFPAITVELRYPPGGGPTAMGGRVSLSKDQAQSSWRYRSFGSAAQPYEYRATYHRAADAGGDVVTPWQEAIDDWLALSDPMPNKRTLNLFVSLPWQDLALGFVEIRYQDPGHGVHFQEQIDLNPTLRYVRRDYPIAAGGPQTLQYRLTLLLSSGPLMEGSWRATDDDRLLLDRRLVDTRHVALQLVGGTLDQNRLASVHVQLEARDPKTAEARSNTEIAIAPGQEAQPAAWDYLIGDPPIQHVHHSGFFVDTDGFVTNSDWAEAQSELLVVNLRNKSITG